MKHFFLLMVVFLLASSGMSYAAETYTWTDANGVKHIVTITEESQKSGGSDNSVQGAEQKAQELQEQRAKAQAEVERAAADKEQQKKVDNSLPPGVDQKGSFQFDINSHAPKP